MYYSLFIEEKRCKEYDGTEQQCSLNEICQFSVCKCKLGYTRLGEGCVKNMSNQVPSPAPYGPHTKTPDEATSHVAAAVIIPIMMILFVIGSVVLVRKYNVVSWVSCIIITLFISFSTVIISLYIYIVIKPNTNINRLYTFLYIFIFYNLFIHY